MGTADAEQSVRDDDEVVWEGPLAWCMRPVSYGSLRRAVTTGSILYLLSGCAALPLVFGLIDVDGAHRVGLGIGGGFGIYAGLVNLVVYRRSTPDQVRRRGPVLAPLSQLLTPVVIGGVVVAAGPNLTVTALYFVQAPIYAFFIMRTRVAVTILVLNMAGYAVALSLIDDQPAPLAHWLLLLSTAMGTAVLVGALVKGIDEAREQLADLNRNLEQRVADQVDELERVGQLRRFLAPQVADVVVSRGSEALLEPHRQDVAVLFVDLRGFTRFTNAVDADTIVDVLGEYYAVVGTVLETHGATIGGYDGDGIMAYLGDPIPRPDAPEAGVAVAREIGAELDALVARWRADGHDLGYGIGLAFGTATLGVVGFDGRFDYTPIGSVVNLAARLCADAAPGEIVIDASVRAAAGKRGARTRGQVELKGYDTPVRTFALAR